MVVSLCKRRQMPTLTKRRALDIYRQAAGLGLDHSIHARVYDWWEELDETVFKGKLKPVLIHIGITEYSGCLGLCQLVEGQSRIVLHKGLLGRPWQLDYGKTEGWHLKRSLLDINEGFDPAWGMYGCALGEQFLKDTLMHEMVHSYQALHYTGAKADWRNDGHKCKSWTEICNAASERLGFDLWMPIYKRGKAPADENGVRKNVWRAVNPEECPKGKRMAEHWEISSWPHLCREPEDYNPALKGATWDNVREAWGAYTDSKKRR